MPPQLPPNLSGISDRELAEKALRATHRVEERAWKLEEEVRINRELGHEVNARVGRVEAGQARASTQLKHLIEGVDTLTRGARESSETDGKTLAALARLEKSLGDLAGRVLMVERVSGQGSSPDLAPFAKVGLRIAELRLEDEDTQVRARRAAAENAAVIAANKATETERRNKQIWKWAALAAPFVGTLLWLAGREAVRQLFGV